MRIALSLIALMMSAGIALADSITVWSYEPPTGKHPGMFTRERQAEESPLEPGTYPVPAYSTTVPVPAPVSGFAWVWDGAQWTQAEDHRFDNLYYTDNSRGALGDEFEPNADIRENFRIGPLPDWLTNKPWPGEFWEWDGATKDWVFNQAAADAAGDLIGRTTDLLQDADTQTIKTRLSNASPQQIEDYVKNKVQADACVDLASCQLSIRRLERATIEILKLLASGMQQ